MSDAASIAAPLTTAAPMAAARVASADDCCWIREGQIASATLYSSIDSTVPGGTISAYLDLPLEDFTHSIIVAPLGAKIVGRYVGTNAVVSGGKVRIPARFDELQMGNQVIRLDDEPGGDPTGTNGLGATTNRHIGAAISSFIIEIATAAILNRSSSGGSQSCTGINCAQTSNNSNNSAIGAAMQAGQQIFQRGTPAESLQVRTGSKITVVFQKDYHVKAYQP